MDRHAAERNRTSAGNRPIRGLRVQCCKFVAEHCVMKMYNYKLCFRNHSLCCGEKQTAMFCMHCRFIFCTGTGCIHKSQPPKVHIAGVLPTERVTGTPKPIRITGETKPPNFCRNGSGVWKIGDFWHLGLGRRRPISETVQDRDTVHSKLLFLLTNRNMYMRFRLVPKSMTFDDL